MYLFVVVVVIVVVMPRPRFQFHFGTILVLQFHFIHPSFNLENERTYETPSLNFSFAVFSTTHNNHHRYTGIVDDIQTLPPNIIENIHFTQLKMIETLVWNVNGIDNSNDFSFVFSFSSLLRFSLFFSSHLIHCKHFPSHSYS